MNDEVTLNDAYDSTTTEEIPSLSEFADEPGGAWPKGWYVAEIIEGYATAKGKVFTTADETSKNGESRNLRLCFKVIGPSGDRTIQEVINYRVTDFNPERLAHIKELRQEYKGVKGRWSDNDGQRSSLAIARLGSLEKSLGFRLKRNGSGGLVPGVFVGQKLDTRLGIDDNGYNEITGFAKLGDKTGHKSKSA